MNALLKHEPQTPFLDEIKHALNEYADVHDAGPIIYASPLSLAELRRESVSYGTYWPTGRRPLAWTKKDGYTLLGFPVCVDMNQALNTFRISFQESLESFLDRQTNN
jgi:hypothetical protein